MKLEELLLWQKLGLTVHGKTKHGTKRYIYKEVISLGFGMHLIVDEDGTEYVLRYDDLINGYHYDISLFENGIWDFGTETKIYIPFWDRVKYKLRIGK